MTTRLSFGRLTGSCATRRLLSRRLITVLGTMFDLPWVIGKRVARTASSMAFNVTLLREVPTGRIDPLLIAHAPEQAFGRQHGAKLFENRAAARLAEMGKGDERGAFALFDVH